MPFRFKKNDRGFSNLTFPLLRSLIINPTRWVFRPELVNPEYMPTTGPCFLYGNHSNYVDPFLMNVWMYDEPTAGVMTREQFHKPISAISMDSVGIVPTSKYVPEPMVIRSVMNMIDQRRMIVIFPEGGRRWDGKPKPLIESTLKLFYKMKIPVHPVQLHGSYLTWPRWADFPRYGKTMISFQKPVRAEDFSDYSSFAQHCKDVIDFDEYSPDMPECYPKHAYKPASGVERLLYRCPYTGKANGVFSPDGHSTVLRFTNETYTMSADSRLIDKHGVRHSLIDIYNEMCQQPMFKDSGDLLLSESSSPLLSLQSDNTLVNTGDTIVKLYENELQFIQNSQTEKIPVSDIRYVSIEQNHKLSLTLADKSYQFYINAGSALQWQHYIKRLLSGEKPIKNV